MEASYFSELINKYSKKVYNLAYHIVGNKEDAEDVVQETFLEVYKHFHGFRGDSSIYTWIYRIAVNKSFSVKKRIDKPYVDDLEEKIAYYAQNETPYQQQEAFYVNPENAFVIHEIAKMIRTECQQVVMKKLPEKQRLVFVMRVILDFSYQEISDTLGLSENVIKSRLHRARESLLHHFHHKCEWFIKGESSSCCREKIGHILAQDTEALKRLFEEIKDFSPVEVKRDITEEEIRNMEQIYKQIPLQEPNTETIKSYVLNA